MIFSQSTQYFHFLRDLSVGNFLIFFTEELLKYLLLAGMLWFFVFKLFSSITKKYRLQKEDFLVRDIFRELSFSFLHVFIVSILIGYPLRNNLGHTAIYFSPGQYGYGWLFSSFFVLYAIHETFFYWSHRMLHTEFFYNWVHFVHHRSSNPSPFTSYCMHPLESILQTAWIIPVLLFIPIHFYVLIAFFSTALLFALIGHLGVELYPRSLTRSRYGRYLNTATIHNVHHLTERHNLGLYFRFWDFLMDTHFTYEEELPIAKERLPK